MTIYIDNECKCHVSNPDGIYTKIEAPEMFNGKCTAYIEGYRVRPEGYTYAIENGVVFGPEGSSVSPWRDLSLLEEFQRQYEEQQANAAAELAEVQAQYDGVFISADEAYAEGVNSI